MQWVCKYSGLSVAGLIPTGSKLFAEINLPYTTKQYKNDNIANFVGFWENLIVNTTSEHYSPRVEVQSLLEETSLVNLFCCYTILAELAE